MQRVGLAQNVTDQRYCAHSTFSPTGSVALATNASNPRSDSLAAPTSGVRVTF